MISVNPFTNQTIRKFKELSKKELDDKLRQSQTAFELWRKDSVATRSKHILQAAAILHEDRERFAEMITAEMGKPICDSRLEIDKCARLCEYYAEHARDFLHDEIVKTELSQSFIAYEPLGTILGIMPWNFPFWQVFRFAVPALLAGNVCLLKHASNVSICSLAIEEIFQKAFLPQGAFQSLLIPSDAVKNLIEDDRVMGVALTGSEAAGSSVAMTAGKQIKKTVLELGGSDPFIVLDDANLKDAVEWAVKSRLVNGGQSCIAAKRFLVHKILANDFAKLLKEYFSKIILGDPMKESTELGPMARIDLAKYLMKQVKDSVKQGAKLYYGEITDQSKTAMVKPLILTHVLPGMTAFDEELFGPVASITEFKTDEEAVHLANHSRFGLGASVWTSDNERGIFLARQIQSGTVYINDMMKSDQRMPFGGVKKSGYGRELGLQGIREFCNIKSIMVN